MTVERKFQHIVLTRYFVRFSHDEADIQALTSPDRAWLDDRFELFRAICFPSVVAQTNKNFIWLLYFDVRTPEDYLEKIRRLVADHEYIKIIIVDRFEPEHRAQTIRQQLDPDAEWLLTTRLDNDDGWRCDFVATLQNALSFEAREFLNYPVGLIYYSGMTFLYRHKSNAFISLIEPVKGFLTVWCGQHLELDRVAPIRQLPAVPAFLQVVHMHTRSNKPRGLRVRRPEYMKGFEAIRLPDPVRGKERYLDLLAFNLTVGAFWAFRDILASCVRRVRGHAHTQ